MVLAMDPTGETWNRWTIVDDGALERLDSVERGWRNRIDATLSDSEQNWRRRLLRSCERNERSSEEIV
jgi:hypothetical protein